MSSLVHINSEDRITGPVYDFDISIDFPQYEKFTHATLADVVIPQTALTFDEPQFFRYTELIGGVDQVKEIVFNAGVWDLGSFSRYYELSMRDNTGYVFSAEFPYYTYVDSSNPYRIVLQKPLISDSPPRWRIFWSQCPLLAKLLGFEPVDTDFTFDNIIATSAYNFAPPNFVYLEISPGFPQCNGSFKTYTPCTFPLSLYSNSGAISKTEQRFCVPVNSSLLRSGNIHVRLYQKNGRLHKIQNDWGFTLILSS